MPELSGLATLLLMLFLLLLAILWIVLPFAVFGIKRRLDVVIQELRVLNSKGRSDPRL